MLVGQPCAGFLLGNGIIVVQATSPKMTRYKEWIKQKSGQLYWMNAWTWPEMWFVGTQVKTTPLETLLLWNTFTKWSPCARDVFQLCPKSLDDIRRELNHGATVLAQIRILPKLFNCLKDPERMFSASSSIVCIQRASDDPTDRPACRIITKYVASLFLREVESQYRENKQQLIHLLAETIASPSARGQIFELSAHTVFTSPGDPVRATLLPPQPDAADILYLPRGLTAFYFDDDDQGGRQIQGNGNIPAYYKPIQTNFPTVDAFIFLPEHKSVILLQVTVSDSHTVITKGLQKVERILGRAIPGKDLSQLTWALVFVSPPGSMIGKVQSPTGKGAVKWEKSLTQYALVLSDSILGVRSWQ